MLRSSLFLSKHLFFIITFFLLTGCAIINSRAKADYTVEAAGMDFVFVNGGTFQMGGAKRANERPVHGVTISDLFVGMTEVTFEQYDQYCEAEPRCEPPSDSGWGRGDRPVINVSWHDANAYAAWLSKQTGLQFRLPTEAEWEYFARAGTTTEFWTGTTLPKGSANCSGCGSKWDNKMTAPTGSFAPNHWKIYDTTGNVIEWVTDDYTNNYNNASTDGSAVIIVGSTRKGQRGGAWDYLASESRAAARDYRHTNDTYNDAGFRLVLIPTPAIPLPTKQ